MKQLSIYGSIDSAIVDDEDFAVASKYKWHLDKHGYPCTFIRSIQFPLHHFVLGFVGSENLALVEHLNDNKLDAQKKNLKLSNKSSNGQGVKKCGIKDEPTCDYIGVGYYPKQNKSKPFQAFIGYGYRKLHIGYFKTANQAARAYNKKAIDLYGISARINVIKEDLGQ